MRSRASVWVCARVHDRVLYMLSLSAYKQEEQRERSVFLVLPHHSFTQRCEGHGTTYGGICFRLTFSHGMAACLCAHKGVSEREDEREKEVKSVLRQKLSCRGGSRICRPQRVSVRPCGSESIECYLALPGEIILLSFLHPWRPSPFPVSRSFR